MVDKVSFKERLNKTDKFEVQAVPVLKLLDFIQQPSEDATLEEAEKLWPILEASLDPKLGYGLTACQIGVLKKVAFIRYANKEYRLLNTKILARRGEHIMYGEGCLSLPGKIVNTVRHSQIVIQDDILGKMALNLSDDGLLCVILQHEVDHFEGKTILDRKQVPVKVESKVGRNSPCPCGSNKKYKKCCM